MPDLTPNQTGDLRWLDGYRMRANGKPKPTEATAADGWADLDALMQLIQAAAKDREKMQAEIDALKVKDEALGARVLELETADKATKLALAELTEHIGDTTERVNACEHEIMLLKNKPDHSGGYG